mgnify:CR=1 FL=1
MQIFKTLLYKHNEPNISINGKIFLLLIIISQLDRHGIIPHFSTKIFIFKIFLKKQKWDVK